MFGNYISVTKLDVSSLASSAQSSALEELAKARAGQASNSAAQAQNNDQKAEAPNDVNAYIGAMRPRLGDGSDLIDINQLKSDAAADSFESQALKQEAIVNKGVYYPLNFGSASNGAAQAQNSGQDVDSRNTVQARIDQPRYGINVGPPKADILVDKLDSTATGSSVQIQDLTEKAQVKKAVPSYCAPTKPGDASNAAAQAQNSGQDIDSGNRVNITENLGGWMPSPYLPDPSVTRLTSTSTGENVQLQQAAQEALASGWRGDASSTLVEAQNNGQTVDSGNRVTIDVNDRVNTFQMAVAERLNSASEATNLQDQSATQKSVSDYFGSADNAGTQGQNSAQDAGSGNWVNVTL